VCLSTYENLAGCRIWETRFARVMGGHGADIPAQSAQADQALPIEVGPSLPATFINYLWIFALQVVKEVTDDALRPAVPETLPTPNFPGQDEYIALMEDCWQQVSNNTLPSHHVRVPGNCMHSAGSV
jgi:hypothetical protein